MKKPAQQSSTNQDTALLKRQLEVGLASGVGKRTPAQIRADFPREARHIPVRRLRLRSISL